MEADRRAFPPSACEPGEQAAFLAAECAGDEVLRREVESLLDFHNNDDARWMRPT
jgi:hypothetical protein